MQMHNQKLAARDLSEMRSLLIVAGGLTSSNKPARPKKIKSFVHAMVQVYADSTERHRQDPKPAKKSNQVKAVATTHHKGPSTTRGLITLPRGKEFLVIVELGADDIPDGVQVIPGTSPAKRTGPPAPPSGTRFNTAMVDLSSLLGRASVKCMNVTNVNGYHLLYVKFEEIGNHMGELGFDTWKNTGYQHLAERLMKRVWGSAVFNDDAAGTKGQSSLTLKKSAAALVATTRISFAIAPVAAAAE